MKTAFDYIVVGAGSAGCALAYRLAANSSQQVLLLEAGSAARNPMIHIPLGFAFLLKKHKNNWGYATVPEDGLGGRSVDLPRGKVLGGCSAINGMVYVRGQREDYDAWAAAGNSGWSYKEVEPYFLRAERGPGEGVYGATGPLPVSYVDNEFPVTDGFVAAAVSAGHRYNPELNGASQRGVSRFPANIFKGRRQTAAKAYLDKSLRPPNLTVISDADVQRLSIEGGRVSGVVAVLKGTVVQFNAAVEVILSAGAINSPKLLELSGIGQAARLAQLGIPLVQDLPGVGENLHDHWNGYIVQGLLAAKSYYSESQPLAMLRNLLRYLFLQRGFLGYPAALVAVFYKAMDTAATPDAQIHFAPAASERDAKGNMVPIDAITVASCGIRPQSRGGTHVVSANPQDAPDIRVNYLTAPADCETAVAAFRKARAILADSEFAAYCGDELAPGPAIESDADILNYLRQTGEPVHHLAGSCKMGSDPLAVVDQQLRVYGVAGLRVADASIMPAIVSGNTHAACVMIGEKAADLILAG